MSPKILIIEDDLISSRFHQHHLKKAGFITQIAMDGRQALEQADSFLPDLILLDIIVPKIDGFSLLKIFKNTHPHSNIPIIVISDLTQESDVNKFTELGANLFVAKSRIDYQKLIKSINNILSLPSTDADAVFHPFNFSFS